MNNWGNLTVLALCLAAEMTFTNPSTNQNIPWDPNTWEQTNTEATIDTSHSIKIWTGEEYERINGIASNVNNEIVSSRNKAGWSANPEITKEVAETLAKEPWNSTWEKESYTKLIDKDDDDLNTDEEEDIKPANHYVVVEDEEWNKTWYIVGDSESAAKTYYKPKEVDAAVTQMIRQGAVIIDMNFYSMSPELMAFYEESGIKFENKDQNQ